MQFLKNVLSSCLGAFLALLLIGVVCLMVVSAFTSTLLSEKEVEIRDNSVLHLKVDGRINELQKENPLTGLPVPGGDKNMGLIQIMQAIDKAKEDPAIKGIYLEVDNPVTFFSSLEEIRQSLQQFRESGKKVIAYNEVLSEGAYYLSSVADKVYLNPQGDLEFNGLTAQFMSFKKLLDNWQIHPQVFRVGEFKSAVEPFLSEEMSPENRVQMQAMVDTIHAVLLQQIAGARNIPVSRLGEIADKMLVRNAGDAVSYGLVDSLLYRDQFENVLKELLELDQDDKLRLVSYDRYRKSYSSYNRSENEIAVIVAEGTIMPGEAEASNELIGADTFVKEIKKAREDDEVKAIVLRVNSPGGEFRSSDMIWREIELASRQKPVIASMGDYAASGGYYIAMACDTIVARPNTITGSIGIFGVMFDLSDFLDHKIGITFDEVRTGDYGEMFTVTRPLTEEEQNFWQKILNDHYATFIAKAAEGRDMDPEEVKKVAAGRVWTGTQALDHGLVDLLGGFDDAVKIAAEKAGIADDYKIRYYPAPKTFLELWLEQVGEDAGAKAMQSEMGDYYTWYKKLTHLKYYQGSQARMPFEFSVK